jgi:hypothetical protein
MSEIPAPALGRSPWWAGGGCFGRHKQKEKTVTTTTTTCSNVAGLVALCERVDSLWWREQTVGMCPRNEYILVGVTFILLDRRPCSYLCGREGSLVAIDLPTPTVATSILQYTYKRHSVSVVRSRYRSSSAAIRRARAGHGGCTLSPYLTKRETSCYTSPRTGLTRHLHHCWSLLLVLTIISVPAVLPC